MKLIFPNLSHFSVAPVFYLCNSATIFHVFHVPTGYFVVIFIPCYRICSFYVRSFVFFINFICQMCSFPYVRGAQSQPETMKTGWLCRPSWSTRSVFRKTFYSVQQNQIVNILWLHTKELFLCFSAFSPYFQRNAFTHICVCHFWVISV